MRKSASGPTSGGLEIDAEHYRRFTSLVESFDALPDGLQADVDNGGTEDEIVGLLLRRLKKAIQDGDTAASKKIVAELGAKSLSPRERELYLKLYDLRMAGNTEKALETLERYFGG